ncbi:MAG: hypothetical protein R2697_16080 [Ilumatobacteraceae bacterium]
MSTEAFPELELERARLTRSRLPRLDDRTTRIGRSDGAAGAITSEYIEMTVWEALDSLRSPGAGDFFGRIDEPSPTTGSRRSGTSGVATSRTSVASRSSSTGVRRSRRRSTGRRRSTRSA